MKKLCLFEICASYVFMVEIEFTVLTYRCVYEIYTHVTKGMEDLAIVSLLPIASHTLECSVLVRGFGTMEWPTQSVFFHIKFT